MADAKFWCSKVVSLAVVVFTARAQVALDSKIPKLVAILFEVRHREEVSAGARRVARPQGILPDFEPELCWEGGELMEFRCHFVRYTTINKLGLILEVLCRIGKTVLVEREIVRAHCRYI